MESGAQVARYRAYLELNDCNARSAIVADQCQSTVKTHRTRGDRCD